MIKKSRSGKVNFFSCQVFYFISLAVSDLTIGLYLALVGSADIMYRGIFYSAAETWRSSLSCKMASSLTILSPTTSAFTLFQFSSEKLFIFSRPFGAKQSLVKLVLMTQAIQWLFFLAVSITMHHLPYSVQDNTCFLLRFMLEEGEVLEDSMIAPYFVFSILLLVMLLLVA